jgi:HD superfamily phosphohydrolase
MTKRSSPEQSEGSPRHTWDLPELRTSQSVIRISPDVNVPVTQRVKRIIDSQAFRRLSRISQLGLVAFVYPGATHSRMEHSLGVYRNAVDFLCRLSGDENATSVVSEQNAKLFLVAALLHDVGHWPFCHAIEDMRLQEIPRHESLANRLITQGQLADILHSEWQLDPLQVAQFLSGTIEESERLEGASGHAIRMLQSMLSGPIDIDKIDYLERDSLHAGVPYGRNFDRNRLISSLCIDPVNSELAITDKGRTAAEMMVFARYIMFSEVYWHHAVRSATAMLQRAVFEISRQSMAIAPTWIDMNEAEMIDSLRRSSDMQPFSECVEGLFGMQRKLYKRVAQFDSLSHPSQHSALARKPYHEIVELSQKLSASISKKIGVSLGPHDILIDAPPVKLEVQFQINVRQADGNFRTLGELSPVVHALATRQFDDMVKRVRIFVRPDLRDRVRHLDFAELVT